MAYEQLTGAMLPSPDGWLGACDLTGVKFAPIPEPTVLSLLLLAGLVVLKYRKP